MSENTLVTLIAAALVAVHLAGFAIVLYDRKMFVILSLINALFAMAVLAYWLVRSFQLGLQALDGRMTALCAVEVGVVAFCVFGLMFNHPIFKVGNAVWYALHFLVSCLALVFFLTFRMRMM